MNLLNIRKLIVVAIVGSLVSSSLQGVEAASFWTPSISTTARHFLHNQDKMRLEVEALTLQSSSSRVLLEDSHTFPFVSRLGVRFHGQAEFVPSSPLKDKLLALHATIVEWSRKPLFLRWPGITRGIVAATLLLVATAQVQAMLAVGGGVLGACGNLIGIIKIGKGAEAVAQIQEIPETLERGIQDLVNRGVYSFGFSFQIPVRRTIPSKSQMAGFEESEKVIVWEYQVCKVLLHKRENALASAKAQIQAQINDALRRVSPEDLPSYLQFSFHSRLGSVGTHEENVQQLQDAAQPGMAPPLGAPEEFEIRYEPVMEVDGTYYSTMAPGFKTHVRLPGAGLQEVEGAPSELLGGFAKAKYHMGWRYVKADFQYQMNGDLSGFKGMHRQVPTEEIGNQEARNRLSLWLGYARSSQEGTRVSRLYSSTISALSYPFRFWKPEGKVSPGDAPIQAMYFKMVYGMRMPFAAIRNALFTHVLSPQDPRFQKPPFELLAMSSVLITHALRYWSAHHKEAAKVWFQNPTTAEDISTSIQAKTAQAQAFAEFLERMINPKLEEMDERNDFFNSTQNAITEEDLKPLTSYLSKEELHLFIRELSMSLWRNGVEYSALREAKPRVDGKGTQAADHNTVIEPDVRTNTANGQSLVNALKGDDVFIASDRLVIKALPPTPSDQMIKVDSSANESSVWRIRPEGVRLSMYKGSQNTSLDAAVITQKRLRPIRDPENMEEPLTGLPKLNGLEAGVRRSAIQLSRVNTHWRQVRQGYANARNLVPITERTRVYIQLRLHKVLMMALFRRGVSIKSLDAWAWAQADTLSRKAWSSGTNVTATMVEDIETIVDEYVAAHPTPKNASLAEMPDMLSHYDGLFIGTGKTRLALEKSAVSLKRTLGLNILVMDGGDLLKVVNKYSRKDPVTKEPALDPDGLLRELKLSRHAPWVIASDSGAETYEPNILSAVAKVVTEEPFGIAGTSDNHLVDQFHATRVETTENFGSKDQDSMAAYLSMIQTLEEGDLWTAEHVTRLFSTGGANWLDNPFFQTEFTNEEIAHLLIPTNDDVVRDLPTRLLGYTAKGTAVDMSPKAVNDAATIHKAGLQQAERHLEKARLWVVTGTYVLLTVAGAYIGLGPAGHFIPFLFTPIPTVVQLLNQLGTFGSLVNQTWAVIPAFLTLVSPLIDASIYLGLGLSLLFIKRWFFLKRGWSDTKVLEGWGLPATLYVSPYAWVHEALEDYSWVGEGLAYISTKSTYLSARLSQVNDKYRAAGNRNTVSPQFRGGAGHEAFEFDDLSTDQAGRHFKSQVSTPLPGPLMWLAKLLKLKPVSPKVIHMGAYEKPEPNNNWGLMARTKDETIGELPYVVPPGRSFDQLPYHVAEYYHENYAGLSWLLIGVRRQASRADRVAKGAFGFFRYVSGVFLGGYAVKSTQAPSPGTKALTAAEYAAQKMPLRMVAIASKPASRTTTASNPTVQTHPEEWHAWEQSASWLGSTHAEPKTSFAQPYRPMTAQPVVLQEARESEVPMADHVEEPALPVAVGEGAAPTPKRALRLSLASDAEGVSAPAESKGLPSAKMHDDIRQRSKRPPKRVKKESSLISKGALSQPVQAPVLLYLEKSGTLGERPESLSEAAYAVLSDIAASLAMPLKKRYLLSIADLEHRASFVLPGSKVSPPTLTLDRLMLEDAVRGVPGAKEALALEYYESLNYLYEVSGVKKNSENRVERERRLTISKVKMFLSLPLEKQAEVVAYFTQHAVYDAQGLDFAGTIYGRSNALYREQTERGIEDFMARRDVIKKMRRAINAYVDKALEGTSEAAVAEATEPLVEESAPVIAAAPEAVPPPVIALPPVPAPTPAVSARKVLRWRRAGVVIGLLLVVFLQTSSIRRSPGTTAAAAPALQRPSPERPLTVPAARKIPTVSAAAIPLVTPAAPAPVNVKPVERPAPTRPVAPVTASPERAPRPTRSPAPKGRDPLDPLQNQIKSLLDDVPQQAQATGFLKKMAGFMGLGFASLEGTHKILNHATDAVSGASSHLAHHASFGLPLVDSSVSSPLYLIKSGDTWSGIAHAFHVSLSELYKLNPSLADSRYIYPSDLVQLPALPALPTLPSIPAYPVGPVDFVPSVHFTMMDHLVQALMHPSPLLLGIGVAVMMSVIMLRFLPKKTSTWRNTMASLLVVLNIAGSTNAISLPKPVPSSPSRIVRSESAAPALSLTEVARPSVRSVQPRPTARKILRTAEAPLTPRTLSGTPIELPSGSALSLQSNDSEPESMASEPAVVADVVEAKGVQPGLTEALELYVLAHNAAQLKPKDFTRQILRPAKKSSRWWTYLVNPVKDLKALYNHLDDPNGNSVKEAKILQAYMEKEIERVFLDAKLNATLSQSAYAAALKAEVLTREAIDQASAAVEKALPEDAARWQAVQQQAQAAYDSAQARTVEAKERLDHSRSLLSENEDFLSTHLDKGSILTPIQTRLREVNDTPWASRRTISERKAAALKGWKGSLPALFVLPSVFHSDDEKVLESQVAVLLGEAAALKDQMKRQDSLLTEASPTGVVDEHIGEALVNEQAAGVASIEGEASQIATTAGIELLGLPLERPTDPVRVYTLPGPAATQTPLSTVSQEAPKPDAWFFWHHWTPGEPKKAKVEESVKAEETPAPKPQAYFFWHHWTPGEPKKAKVEESVKAEETPAPKPQAYFFWHHWTPQEKGADPAHVAQDALHKQLDERSARVQSAMAAFEEAGRAYSEAVAALNAKEADISEGTADRQELLDVTRRVNEARVTLGQTRVQVKEASRQLELLANADPQETYVLNPVTLTITPVEPIQRLTSAESQTTRESRQMSLALTGGTESAAALGDFFKANELTLQDVPAIQALAKRIQGFPTPTSRPALGQQLVLKLKTTAAAVQEYAKLKKTAVPESAALALRQALSSVSDPESRLSVLVSAAGVVSQKVGPAAFEPIEAYLHDGEPMNYVVRVIAQDTTSPEFNIQTTIAKLKIVSSVVRWANQIGLFADSPLESRLQFLDVITKFVDAQMLSPLGKKGGESASANAVGIADLMDVFVKADMAATSDSFRADLLSHEERKTVFSAKLTAAIRAIIPSIPSKKGRGVAVGGGANMFLGLSLSTAASAFGLPAWMATSILAIGVVSLLVTIVSRVRGPSEASQRLMETAA